MTEEESTAGAFMKIAVFTVFACIGFFGLWVLIFLLSLPLMNFGLSLFLSMLVSAIVIFALITILPRRRGHLALSRRQTIGLYVAWVIVFAFSLPLIKINSSLFLGYLPTLAVGLAIIHYSLRRRKGKGMAQE